MRRAVEWLLARQRADGGWGEDGKSYWADQPRGEAKESTPSQTAWALLGLMAAGETAHPAVDRGIGYLDATISGSSKQIRQRAGTFMVGGTPEASTNVRLEMWPAAATPKMRSGRTGAVTFRMPATAARHQSSGSCSL